MLLLEISSSQAKSLQQPTVQLDHFQINKGERWAVVGGNGSGKSTFATLIAAAGNNSTPSLNSKVVSFEIEQTLLEREIYEDDSEWLDKADPGRTTRQLIEEIAPEPAIISKLTAMLELTDFLNTGFRLLSTGERRRLMLARALATAPDVLILDEPFDGLDCAFSSHLSKLIDQISTETAVILITNRLSQISPHITHIACLHGMRLITQGPASAIKTCSAFRQLSELDFSQKTIPQALTATAHPEAIDPVVEMRDTHVFYHDKTILKDLNWTIRPGQHWKVSGPNGCGKSTLVNLISGDHPQCYSNEIFLFGKKRGVGESIWDVKHYMGLMSTTLHQQHRITLTAETVVLSGFFDTIGVYRPVTAAHKKLAHEWLDFLHLSDQKFSHFHQLSFGQQRMLLIARALIKRPRLLILDEPCQGLDTLNRALVLHLIREIINRDIAQVIYISHEPEDHIQQLTHELSFTPCPPTQPPSPEAPAYFITTKTIKAPKN